VESKVYSDEVSDLIRVFEMGGNALFGTQLQRAWNHVYVLGFCGGQNLRVMDLCLGYLVEELSKQNIGGATWLILTTYSG
jgi:hypothetical protein